jgi:hypothetical protein
MLTEELKDIIEEFLTSLFTSTRVTNINTRCCGPGFVIFSNSLNTNLSVRISKNTILITSFRMNGVFSFSGLNFFSNVDKFKSLINSVL